MNSSTSIMRTQRENAGPTSEYGGISATQETHHETIIDAKTFTTNNHGQSNAPSAIDHNKSIETYSPFQSNLNYHISFDHCIEDPLNAPLVRNQPNLKVTNFNQRVSKTQRNTGVNSVATRSMPGSPYK